MKVQIWAGQTEIQAAYVIIGSLLCWSANRQHPRQYDRRGVSEGIARPMGCGESDVMDIYNLHDVMTQFEETSGYARRYSGQNEGVVGSAQRRVECIPLYD